MDLGPWMTPILHLRTPAFPASWMPSTRLLLRRPILAARQDDIVNYVANTTNLPYTTPAHLIPKCATVFAPSSTLHHSLRRTSPSRNSFMERNLEPFRHHPPRVHPPGRLRRRRHRRDDLRHPRPALHERRRRPIQHHRLQGAGLHLPPGGNDSNNLIIPTLTSEYNNYAAIRTPVLAMPQSLVAGHLPGQ